MSKLISAKEIFCCGGRNNPITIIFFPIDNIYYKEFNSYFFIVITLKFNIRHQ